MNLTVIGTQWGDEGKGRIIDLLTPNYDFIVRYQGGNNAGHTIVVGDQKYAFHLIPSGILYPGKICCLAAGVIIDPIVLLKELEGLHARLGNKLATLLIDPKCNLIMPWHIARDQKTMGKIGTTGRGIGSCYTDQTARRGITIGSYLESKYFGKRIDEEVINNSSKAPGLNSTIIYREYANVLRKIFAMKNVRLADVGELLDKEQSKKNIFFEGAQATLLDVRFGTYPFVTSSHPTVGGVYVGTGFYPKDLKTLGVVKAYTTRVGNGPFPTEQVGKVGKHLLEKGHERGTTTGRARRCGWLDLPIIRYARRVNGLSQIALTKLDVLSGLKEIKIATEYTIGKKVTKVFSPNYSDLTRTRPKYKTLPGWLEDITTVKKFKDLPRAAQQYVRFIETQTALPVKYIGTGPERSQIIVR